MAETLPAEAAAAPQPAAVAGVGQPPAPRQRERFSWVRTKLRPGEKWKRRLPKVAW